MMNFAKRYNEIFALNGQSLEPLPLAKTIVFICKTLNHLNIFCFSFPTYQLSALFVFPYQL
jgi:hypothetical protein